MEMKKMGYDPMNQSLDQMTPEGLGNFIAKSLLEARHHDGANQLGDEVGSDGEPYSDYTMYRPVNPIDKIILMMEKAESSTQDFSLHIGIGLNLSALKVPINSALDHLPFTVKINFSKKSSSALI